MVILIQEIKRCWRMFLCFYKEWIEDNISQKSKDFAGVSGVTIKCNNLQSVSKITEWIWGWPKYKLPATGISFYKNPLVNNELKWESRKWQNKPITQYIHFQ